jgi:hypothetical protein
MMAGLSPLMAIMNERKEPPGIPAARTFGDGRRPQTLPTMQFLIQRLRLIK